MTRTALLPTALSCALALTGCGALDTINDAMDIVAADRAAAARGPVLDDRAGLRPAEPAALVREYMEGPFRRTLRDPDSMQLDMGDVDTDLTIGRCNDLMKPNARARFWVAEVSVNARNGYGGLTGATPNTVFIADGEVVGHMQTPVRRYTTADEKLLGGCPLSDT